MIKWDWFWKLLKQLFFGLLISCFILLGGSFVNAGYQAFLVWNEKTISNWNTQYEVWILPKWRLLTSYLGYTKELIWLDNQMFFFWSARGLYAYVNTSTNWVVQWYFQYFYPCNEITLDWTWDFLQNCTSEQQFDINNQQIIWNFVNTLKSNDLVYIQDDSYHNGCWWYCTYYTYHIRVCFSSHEIWQTLCFHWWSSTYPSYNNPAPLTWSMWFDNKVNFSNINWDLLYQPPLYWGSWSSWGGWTQLIPPESTYTWDYTYWECTYKQIVDRLDEDWFSKYFCYWWLDNFDLYNPSLTYSPIPWSWKTLNQIWVNAKSTWDTPQEWYDFWNWLYIDRYSSQNWSDMWSSYPAVYRTWFDLYYTYWWDKKYFPSVLEYCNIVLSLDSLSGSVYRWDTFEWVCETIYDENRTWIWGSWEIIQWLNWDWVWGLSWNKTYSDPWVFITDMFTKIKSYIPTDLSNTWFWFLPVYIISFMLFLMLFRFLSH